MKLGDFLQAQSANAEPWNCSTLAADWCLTLGYPDFAAAWRDITDPGPCEAVPADAGGLLNLWEFGIGSGLPEASYPLQAGDIAVVRAHGYEAGAIFTGEQWALRAARTIHFVAMNAVMPLKAWRP